MTVNHRREAVIVNSGREDERDRDTGTLPVSDLTSLVTDVRTHLDERKEELESTEKSKR